MAKTWTPVSSTTCKATTKTGAPCKLSPYRRRDGKLVDLCLVHARMSSPKSAQAFGIVP